MKLHFVNRNMITHASGLVLLSLFTVRRHPRHNRAGTCTFFTSSNGFVKFVPSTANKALAYGMVGCNADCSTCTSFSKCVYNAAELTYSCVSPTGGMLIKPLYAFPDMVDRA